MFDCEPWYFLLSTGTESDWVYYQHFWGVYAEAFVDYSNAITARVKFHTSSTKSYYEFSNYIFGKFTSNAVYWYSGSVESQYNKTLTNYKWLVIGE